MNTIKLSLLSLLSACGIKAPVTVIPTNSHNSLNSQCSTNTDKPNLLIIGDSISEGYTPFVKAKLALEYDVSRVGNSNCAPVNAEGTKTTLDNVDRWLDENPNLSVITWNNGNWDSTQPGLIINGVEHYTTDLEYEENLIRIARKLKASGARVIFFTTTEIAVEMTSEVFGRDIIMNDIAKRVLPLEGVEVYDLHALSVEIRDDHPTPSNIHFTDFGSNILANRVVEAIRGQLPPL